MNVQTLSIDTIGGFPNNPELPLVLYRNVMLEDDRASETVAEMFRENEWQGIWRDGVFDYHHYHSNTHEALGCYSGRGSIQFGGPEGNIVTINRGDVVILPAGVSHKKIEATDDFGVVGAYPNKTCYDMCIGKEEDLCAAEKRIARVPLPDTDPVFGRTGGINEIWRAE